MKLLIISGSIIIPIIMFFLQKGSYKWRVIFHLIAILSLFIFGNISALTVHEVIRDETVFMTNIHGIFLNPFFLITGSYLGAYVLYLTLLLTIKENRQS